jgi:hypothetical protein
MLGLLVQAMATGGLPLGVADPHQLRSRSSAVFGPLPPVTLKRPLFPERLQVMITRMMAFAPADRHARPPCAHRSPRALGTPEPDAQAGGADAVRVFAA